jgi:hypothetical protein
VSQYGESLAENDSRPLSPRACYVAVIDKKLLAGCLKGRKAVECYRWRNRHPSIRTFHWPEIK